MINPIVQIGRLRPRELGHLSANMWWASGKAGV